MPVKRQTCAKGFAPLGGWARHLWRESAGPRTTASTPRAHTTGTRLNPQGGSREPVARELGHRPFR